MSVGGSGDDTSSPSEQEIAQRRDAALLRALTTPHKKQKEMKLGKRRLSAKVEERDDSDNERNDRDSVGDSGSD